MENLKCKDCIVLPVCEKYCEPIDYKEDLIVEFFEHKCCLDCGHDKFIVSNQINTKFHMICESCMSHFKFLYTFKDQGNERIGYFRDCKSGPYAYRLCQEIKSGQYIIDQMIKHLNGSKTTTKLQKLKRKTREHLSL